MAVCSLRSFDAFAPFETTVAGFVHCSARADPLEFQRHRSFIASHLAGGLMAFAALPLYLALWGAPGARESVALAWLAAPILSALFLARTGCFEAAHLLSAVSFTGLATYVAWWTGGLTSFVIGWLVIVPLEAALSGSRRVVIGAVACAAAAVVGLYAAGAAGLLPLADSLALGSAALVVGAVTSIVYAGGVAVGLERSHRAAQAAARVEDERYRLLADNVTDLITRHTRSGLVTFASTSARSLMGVESESLLGDGLFARVHVVDRPAFLQAFDAAARQDEPVPVEFRVRRESPKGVEWRWVEMLCRRIGGNGNAEIEIVAVARDIEERRRDHERLEAANAKAEEANAAKSRFLANMSHELRTPLNAIIGFSEMMTQESFKALSEDRVAEYATLINDSGRHLLDVVNGILDMSKIETGSFDVVPEPFDLRELVINTVALMQPAAEKARVHLLASLPADAPELVADRRACKQIFLNLLSNAVKFTDPGGRVTASARFDDHNAYLSVTDTGIGIDEVDLPKLAVPFVQAQSSYDRRYEGTGLGLSVVKGLAALHGGDLSIRSRLGEGTTVTVRLPIDCEAARQNVAPFPRPSETPADMEPSSERNARYA